MGWVLYVGEDTRLHTLYQDEMSRRFRSPARVMWCIQTEPVRETRNMRARARTWVILRTSESNPERCAFCFVRLDLVNLYVSIVNEHRVVAGKGEDNLSTCGRAWGLCFYVVRMSEKTWWLRGRAFLHTDPDKVQSCSWVRELSICCTAFAQKDLIRELGVVSQSVNQTLSVFSHGHMIESLCTPRRRLVSSI